MIPKTAFAALAALAAVFWLFGAVCDKLITKWTEGHTDGSEDEEKAKHDCNTCKYGKVSPREEPCQTCLTQDVDMWEAKG